MKRRILSTGILALLVGMAGQAQASRLGIHGVYSNGGDVEESELGFGGQLELSVNPMFSIELAVSRFSDVLAEEQGYIGQNFTTMTSELDLTTIGLSAVFRGPLAPQLQGYLLVGADYNIIDSDINVDPPIVSNGVNIDFEVDTDDELGFHVGAGVNYALPYNWEFFAEYRYTFLEIESEIAVTGSKDGTTVSIPIGEGERDYDFGLAKVGLNFLF
jgi:opacity protein-like surface antigen